jgi:hypothetical protein
VYSAFNLIKPWTRPKKIDTGRKKISFGYRRNRSASLIYFVKRYQVMAMAQPVAVAALVQSFDT